MNFIEIPKEITINSLIKFFDDCDLGTIVFPLYIYKAKHSNNKDEINNMNKYFSILGNAYCSLNQNTNNNLIYEYTNQFKKSFEYMISKLNALGFESDKFKISKILPFDENEMIFMNCSNTHDIYKKLDIDNYYKTNSIEQYLCFNYSSPILVGGRYGTTFYRQ